MRFITSLCCALFALTLVATPALKAEAVGPTHLGSLAAFLGTPKVQDTLHLTSAQRSQIDAIRASLRQQTAGLVKNTPSTSAAYAASEVKLKAALHASNKQAYQVLTPAQQAQVIKLEGKVLGGSLLLSDVVQQKLQLTAAQKSQIAAIHAKTKAANNAIAASEHQGKIGHFQQIARLRKARKAEAAQLLKVLTPAQHAAFKKLIS